MRIPRPWFRKSNKTWYVQIRGRQVNLGKNKTEAHAKYRKLMAQSGADMRINDVLLAYYRWLKKERSPETVKTRAKVLKSFAKFSGKMRVSALRPFHVQEWIGRQKRVKSPTTVNTRVTLIIGALNWGVKMGYIGENPIAGMPKPTPVVRQEFIPANLWQDVLALATDEPFRNWLAFMLATGARVTEMFKLEAGYFDGRVFTLPIAKSKGKKRSRAIVVPDDMLPLVKQLIAENPAGPIFRNRRGVPWNRNSIRCRFRLLKRKLKMPTLTATTLRHSYAHHRLTSGQDSLTVAKLLGHVDTRMLATRYGHLEANTDYMIGAANQIRFPSLEGPTVES